jgi:magnesium transporter
MLVEDAGRIMYMGKELPTLRSFSYETAAEHLHTRVPVASRSSPVDEIRRSLGEKRYDSLTHIAILEGTKLVGVLTIENLFSTPEGSVAEQVMDAQPPVVAPGTDQEVAAWRAVEHRESALAVVDEEGNFLGFVPPHQLLVVLLWEHEEDMDRLGGFFRGTSEARAACQEPAGRRFRHRVPWLLVGLVGALLSADIVGAFEQQLKEAVVLAFFIPGIVYLADAVGTQTETVVIRGLSVGVSLRQMARPELLSGLLMGLALSSIFLPVAFFRWGDSEVAIAVSLSLFAACSVATLIAMALPGVIHRLGWDPAFGSGPLATVIQDLLSILIYFVIASYVVG